MNNILGWFETVDCTESIITIIAGAIVTIGTAIRIAGKKIKEELDKKKEKKE